ncbi:hypothetical protein [Thioalkalivibrio sp. ALMg9]|uniref:hypothetical protein n=1 Tax=Thioalkalivibrio sp. ALMg9 TaxID=1266912 RepID=UPI0012DCF4D1|nr:hypothetical protein [Thioalkalivibrio sp. ALMg9]
MKGLRPIAFGAVVAGSAALVFLTLGSAPATDFEIALTDGESADRGAVEQDLARFTESCPDLLSTHQDRIQHAEAQHRPAMPYRANTYGWESELRLRVKIADDGRAASGHVVDYYIGQNGWLTQKAEGAHLCGLPGDTDRDTFVEL